MVLESTSTKGKSRLFPCHHFALRVTTKDSLSVENESPGNHPSVVLGLAVAHQRHGVADRMEHFTRGVDA